MEVASKENLNPEMKTSNNIAILKAHTLHINFHFGKLMAQHYKVGGLELEVMMFNDLER